MVARSKVYGQRKVSKPKVSGNLKNEVKEKADKFVETVLVPRYVKPPQEDAKFNYVIKIYTKWYSNYLYFCSTYHVSGSNAIQPTFANKFARLEYDPNNGCNLAYMRHTEQWQEIGFDLSIDDALNMIEENEWFTP